MEEPEDLKLRTTDVPQLTTVRESLGRYKDQS